METQETADVKEQQAATDTATADGSSATATETLEQQSVESTDQASPDNAATAVAGEQQAAPEETKEQQQTEESTAGKPEAKSRTARRINELLDGKKQAEKKAALLEEELAKVRNLPSAATQTAQQQQSQLPPEQTSNYWAQKYHAAQQSGTATPEELQNYTNQYHALAAKERERDLEGKVEQKLGEFTRRIQYTTLIKSQLDEINRVTPFYRDGTNGQPEYIADSPVLVRAYSKAQQAGVPITTQEGLIHWLNRAQVDLLLEGAVSQTSVNQQLKNKAAQIVARTGLQAGSGSRVSSGSASLENTSRDDQEQLAVRQFHAPRRKG